MQLTLSEVANELHVQHLGDDVSFSRVSTDTRSITKGDLYVALQGKNFDGHDFLQQAQDSGAVAAMVNRQLKMMLPMLKVQDTRLGLGQLSALWRARFTIPCIAVTGSNGKTTVKEMLSAVLSKKGNVLATMGNLNNEIGVPLTLLRLQDHHQSAVIEMGANHAGEIQYLSNLARPDVAIITNAGPAHLEGFGSIDGVANAKGEIFSSLNMNGTAVINQDDKYAPLWKELSGSRKIISFGVEQAADVSATWEQKNNCLQLSMHTPVGECEVLLHLPGQHNVMNALAATAAAIAVGVDLSLIVEGLESISPVAGRLQMQAGLQGMQILNDTYNANPSSFEAALDVMTHMQGEKWLALGDMGELGPDAVDIHRACGELARKKGIQKLYAVGELASYAVEAFGGAGVCCESLSSMADQIKKDWLAEGVLLIKGSRLMHMEQLVSELQPQGEME